MPKLCKAAKNGEVREVRHLISKGADVNKADIDGRTPLYEASANGHESVVRLLIAAEADVNKADNNGWTPLLGASFNGHEPMVSVSAFESAHAGLTGTGHFP